MHKLINSVSYFLRRCFIGASPALVQTAVANPTSFEGTASAVENPVPALADVPVTDGSAEQAKTWVVTDQSLPFDAATRQVFATALAQKNISNPTPAQWQMITSTAPATYVIAAAGSGKSTSLVLRLIALEQMLKIDHKHMSVFTFTRASRADFIAKLTEKYALWDIPLSDTSARKIVKTFHSMVLRMAYDTINPRPQVLEIMDMELTQQRPVDPDEVDNLLAIEPARPPITTKPKMVGDPQEQNEPLRSHKDRLQRLAYERAYQDPVTRQAMLELLRATATLKRTDYPVQRDELNWVAKHDAKVCAALEQCWRQRIAVGRWPLQGVQWQPYALDIAHGQHNQDASTGGQSASIMANGFIPSLNAYVVLAGPWPMLKDLVVEGVSNLGALIKTKRQIVDHGCDQPVVWIHTEDDLEELRTQLRWLIHPCDARISVPMLHIKLQGKSKAQPILQAMFELASFTESLGLNVSDTLLAQAAQSTPGISRADQALALATGHYWRHFEAVLQERSVWTFSQLFAHFSEDNPAALMAVPDTTLGAMQHLMIDEFQDISPQIVHWVRGCQRELKRRNQAGTLMCIGDDWQSIYGWRGSSPDFFMNFEQHFPAKEHAKITLEDNFRSSQKIVSAASGVLRGVAIKLDKTTRASGAGKEIDSPVRLVPYATSRLPTDAIAQAVTTEVQRTQASVDHPVFVLVRSGAQMKALRDIVRSHQSAVEILTIHTSKGLEARSVIVVGDCVYKGTQPLKNYLYQTAHLGGFDQAQHDEARRLAYVAITRAKEHCIWFANPQDGGAFDSMAVDGVNTTRQP